MNGARRHEMRDAASRSETRNAAVRRDNAPRLETGSLAPVNGAPVSAPVVPRRAVALHIGELVLHGVAPLDSHRISQAVERELTRILADEGLPASLASPREVERLDAGAFEMKTNAANAEVFGSQIARALYGGLKQ